MALVTKQVQPSWQNTAFLTDRQDTGPYHIPCCAQHCRIQMEMLQHEMPKFTFTDMWKKS